MRTLKLGLAHKISMNNLVSRVMKIAPSFWSLLEKQTFPSRAAETRKDEQDNAMRNCTDCRASDEHQSLRQT